MNVQTAIPKLIWAPQAGPQHSYVDCPLPLVFFGGARGGGKTDAVLGKWAIKDRLYGENFNAIMFRRTTVSSEDAIERSKQIYKPLGGSFNGSALKWRMPNGGRVAFAYLDRVTDADEYQGRNVTDAWVEEAGQYPDPTPIDRLFGVMRGTIPVQMTLTANPGGPGQGWLRDRFQLYPFPRTSRFMRIAINEGSTQAAVIPSRLTDNIILTTADPTYIDRLHMVGSAKLVRAWVEGDWSAIDGAFFDGWDESKHVCEPFEIPEGWLRFRSMDWGFAAPFSVGWFAVVGDNGMYGGKMMERGALVRYREWYGASGPNKGLRLTAEEVGAGIKEREAGEKVTYGVLDPAAFAEDGGPSIGERLNKMGLGFRPADNKRVSRAGAIGGWDQFRARLQDERLFVSALCKDFIRTIPMLQHDPDKPEDLDTEAEDHVADEARYGMMSRPYVKAGPKPAPGPTRLEYWAQPDGTIKGNMTPLQWLETQKKRKAKPWLK